MDIKFEDILKKYWGYDSFRPLQKEIITSVYQSKDCLALMPTGGGKSICFQVPAMAKEGLCLVITPLIALMLDQVERLKSLKIPAEAIYSGMNEREIQLIYNKACANQLKFLYISPERLKTPLFLHQLEGMNVNLIAVDEAHCISEWGTDFRPAYYEINTLREYLPHIPILALTASANQTVIEDIKKQLDLKDVQFFKQSFFRENIRYIIRYIENKKDYLLQIVNKIQGSGIIYVRNRKLTQDLAYFLTSNQVSADFYHAGLPQEIRNLKQQKWQNNTTKIMVATNAFGMGIDKNDVRFVIHYTLPDSLEAYYQEAGRAGRDGKMSFAGVLYNNIDIQYLEQQIETSFPPLSTIQKIYAALGSFFQLPIGAGKDVSFAFDFPKFLNQYQLNFSEVYSSLKILEKEGWIKFEEQRETASKIHIIISNRQLYQFYINNPDFEGFIRLLLGTYQGLFSEFVKINEYKIARKANIQVDVVKKYLRLLRNNHIIEYEERSQSARITFLEERMDAPYLHISNENLRLRKENKARKINSVFQFISPNTDCRSKALLSYFDEDTPDVCGICDACSERQNHSNRVKDLQKEILRLLKEQSYSAKDLVSKLKTNHNLLFKAIQPLLDEEQIHIKDNMLYI